MLRALGYFAASSDSIKETAFLFMRMEDPYVQMMIVFVFLAASSMDF
jgi:hypothetical protein